MEVMVSDHLPRQAITAHTGSLALWYAGYLCNDGLLMLAHYTLSIYWVQIECRY